MAYARVHDAVVVTHEVFNADVRKRVPIPNVCRQFDVDYRDTFAMLRELEVRFEWTPLAALGQNQGEDISSCNQTQSSKRSVRYDDEYAKRFNYDLDAICLQEKQRLGKRRVISLPPKRPRKMNGSQLTDEERKR